ncbi:MAG: amino acid permease [Pyrinomonadaceae bacterium]|nr:amino acid permease [Pyrinomonadaceae bacterium]
MVNIDDSDSTTKLQPRLARRLGLFDATMIVMGGIIGSGIFMNPSVVARQVTTPFLILGVWVLGGLVALIAAFIWAELAALRPEVGGQYAYLREAYHPLVAFLYGWGLLLVIQTGGMAAVAVTFARYFLELTRAPVSDSVVAMTALGGLTLINCLGVRTGSTVQSVLMVLKILAIIALIGCGFFLVIPQTGSVGEAIAPVALLDQPASFDLITAVGAAMVPVLFAFGGWQTASFVAGEIRDARKNLPRALVVGVIGVIVLYLAVNFVCLRVLGVAGLAATSTPASDVMRFALGPAGARALAAGIAISTLGFLSQGMLTAPRVYFAMAKDGLFFKSVGRLHPKTQVPIIAIALQGILAMIIARSGSYDKILNYVVSVDFIFFGATAVCIFVFRRREAAVAQPFGRASSAATPPHALPDGRAAAPSDVGRITRVPGHPLTTLAFIAICWLVVINTVYRYPENTLIGLAILVAGIPFFFFWRRRQ